MAFSVWITFILLQQKKNLNCIKKLCENKDFCSVIMPSEDNKILEFNELYCYEYWSKKKSKKWFFLKKIKLMKNAVFGKTLENVKKYRVVKLFTAKRRRNYLISEPNYHCTKFFTEHLLTTEMKKQRYLQVGLSL